MRGPRCAGLGLFKLTGLREWRDCPQLCVLQVFRVCGTIVPNCSFYRFLEYAEQLRKARSEQLRQLFYNRAVHPFASGIEIKRQHLFSGTGHFANSVKIAIDATGPSLQHSRDFFPKGPVLCTAPARFRSKGLYEIPNRLFLAECNLLDFVRDGMPIQ